ncbi:MAG: helicase-related protein, partial [Methylococcus sp.]
QSYAKNLPGFHVLPIYGGQSYTIQLKQLSRGAHVIVGTPGRVMDHLERKTLNLDNLKTMVLDEADEMLRMGFIDDVEWILERTPEQHQTALFSATMPEQIRRVAQKYLVEPREIKIKSATATVAAIRQVYWQVSGMHKLDALTRILEVEEDFDAAIIFVRTKTATVELAEKLEARGYEAAALNGDMTQILREKVIDRLKKGSLDIVIATDVAARGLDVERITHVVNYDIPYDTETYVHRIGRTGRAGRKGTAILFVAPRERRMLRAIEQATRQPIQQMRLPTLRDIADKRIEQFKAQLVETLDGQDISFYRDLIDKLVAEEIGEPADIAAAIAHLLYRERPLPAADEPEQPPVRESSRDSGERRPPRRSDRYEGQRENRGEYRRPEGDMQNFTIDVGRSHGVMPKDIVGAIANEGGIAARQIGAIKLFDSYSTVELPAGLPREVFQALSRTWIRGQRINLQPAEAGPRRGPAPAQRHYGGNKPEGDTPPRKRKIEGLTLPPSKYRKKPDTEGE